MSGCGIRPPQTTWKPFMEFHPAGPTRSKVAYLWRDNTRTVFDFISYRNKSSVWDFIRILGNNSVLYTNTVWTTPSEKNEKFKSVTLPSSLFLSIELTSNQNTFLHVQETLLETININLTFCVNTCCRCGTFQSQNDVVFTT